MGVENRFTPDKPLDESHAGIEDKGPGKKNGCLKGAVKWKAHGSHPEGKDSQIESEKGAADIPHENARRRPIQDQEARDTGGQGEEEQELRIIDIHGNRRLAEQHGSPPQQGNQRLP